MNSKIIRYLFGKVLIILGMLLLLPCLTALIYREQEGYMYLMVAVVTVLLGLLFSLKKPEDTVFYFKDGCFITALSWVIMSAIGAVPFVLTGEIPFYVDALFETVSGFTTTGASILSNVEALSHCSLLWRSFTHWIGGMGVLVFLLAIVPMNGGSHMNLMRAESPGPSVGKLVPKAGETAKILYVIYMGLTVLEFIFLVCGKMPVFDAICTSFGTAGTGGFGIKCDSMLSYSPYIQWVVTVFMLLFGVNFNAYFLVLFGQIKKALSMEEVKTYFAVIVGAVAIITFDVVKICGNFKDAIRHTSFTVASIITTTGFGTIDFNKWSVTSRLLLVSLMFIGACAGSTGGGIKVSRFIILFKTVKKELLSYMHPKSIKKIKMDDRPVEHEVVRSTDVYFITFVIIFVVSLFAISIDGKDLVTSFTAVAATINNIGPGLELVGPTENYAFFSPFSKIVLMIDMLAGRLELFPLVLLFYPVMWRDLLFSTIREKRKKKKID
ncbi:MAG: TrkH family potassium uptake protein [Lachnospiraceae bacterium]|nr:TrkH family potassium uptake protein [Lachnospiraceae bacterium]